MSQKLINTSHPMGGREKKTTNYSPLLIFLDLIKPQKKKKRQFVA